MKLLSLLLPIALIVYLRYFYAKAFPTLRAGARPLAGAVRDNSPVTGRQRRDVIVLTAVYALVAFTNLGSLSAPESFCRFQKAGQYALLELDEPVYVSKLLYYPGLHTGEYRLQSSADGISWTEQPAVKQSYSELFSWREAVLEPTDRPVRYLRLTATAQLELGEVAVYDAQGLRVDNRLISASGGAALLLDEPDTVPLSGDYLNGSYFDEIYHARTAYEHIRRIYPYEITHPPLGKLLIGLGIRLFGMVPFGWRFAGTLAGVAMLPVLYLFARKMFGGHGVPLACMAILATDFMHFTQTRIATIDSFGVLFTLLMYFFFYSYLSAPREADGRRRNWRRSLALAGAAFGLGAASKWTCLYAGAGLGLLWLLDWIFRFRQCPAGERPGLARELRDNILWCLLFFVLLPCAIYYVSYYPYGLARGMRGVGMFFRRDYAQLVLHNQQYMFSYHADIVATHPYSSRWYQWVLDVRPILYYLKDLGADKSAFGAFVNPVLCWGGLVAMLGMAWLALFRRDRKALFILLGYLAQLLPWCFVSRIVFFYHYFPSLIFLVLALGYLFDRLRRFSPAYRQLTAGFCAVSAGLFAAFYPVISGLPVPRWYTTNVLNWLPGMWPF